MHFKEFCKVLKIEASAIESGLARFEKDSSAAKSIDATVELILKSTKAGGKVIVLGLGKSGKIGAKIAATLSSTGTPALYVHATEALHGDLGVVGAHDVVLAISYTGNTGEVVDLIPYFEKRGAPVIALTGNSKSRLAERSKFVLNCEVSEEACAHNLAPTSSTTFTLALGDALAIAVMKARGFTADDFAKNHPGGALGRRLQLAVRDLMHGLDKSPVVNRASAMHDIITLSTERKLGAVLVCEGKKLVGIITDGDIRRALKQKEKFFALTAGEVMTNSPITVDPNCLAYDALQLMEKRESQISVLPVVDSGGAALGLLRIHDLVQSF